MQDIAILKHKEIMEEYVLIHFCTFFVSFIIRNQKFKTKIYFIKVGIY